MDAFLPFFFFLSFKAFRSFPTLTFLVYFVYCVDRLASFSMQLDEDLRYRNDHNAHSYRLRYYYQIQT